MHEVLKSSLALAHVLTSLLTTKTLKSIHFLDNQVLFFLFLLVYTIILSTTVPPSHLCSE